MVSTVSAEGKKGTKNEREEERERDEGRRKSWKREVSKNFQFSAFQYRHRLRRFVCAAERQKDEDRRVIKQEKTKGRGIGDDGGRRESRNEWYSVYSGLSYVVRAQPTSVPASRH